MTAGEQRQRPAPWTRHLSTADRALLARGGFGRRMGFGARPALLVIDCQNYMVGTRGRDDERYPSRCGPQAWEAVDRIAGLRARAHEAGVAVFFTRFALDPSGRDMGVYRLKRDLLEIPYWCLEGTPGAEIVAELKPAKDDIVLVKRKPSAFHGTKLLGLLVERGIDTLVIVGGATSNCVRATVFDAASHDLRAMVPADCVFDRIEISHEISLFDMDRQFADVIDSADVHAYFGRLAATTKTALEN